MLYKRLFFFRPRLDPLKAGFLTHLNYVRRIEHLLSGCGLTVTPGTKGVTRDTEVARFMRLHAATHKSIKKDVELAGGDPAFAVIAAPWLPVKCYYALYYLETNLFHLLDGNASGFVKGGHTAIRKKLAADLTRGVVSFSNQELNRTHTLREVDGLPALIAGQNTRATFWQEDGCTDSILKKLTDYKFHDQRTGKKWNLRTKKDQRERDLFMERERVTPLDFFYWYRIKANYRDLDYIDFENGVTEDEVLAYLRSYNAAYLAYRKLLLAEVGRLRAAA